MTQDRDLVVFGAGGHGKVVAETAVQAGWSVRGFLDDAFKPGMSSGLSMDVLGDRTWLARSGRDGLYVALGIGNNYTRASIARFLKSQRVALATIISPYAAVSPTAKIGMGTVVMPGAIINAMATIGEAAVVNSRAVIEHDVQIGSYAHIAPGSTLGGGVEVGEYSQVSIGATVLPLIRIGRNSVLGAGSLATRSIPEGVIAFGIPARARRSISIEEAH